MLILVEKWYKRVSEKAQLVLVLMLGEISIGKYSELICITKSIFLSSYQKLLCFPLLCAAVVTCTVCANSSPLVAASH